MNTTFEQKVEKIDKAPKIVKVQAWGAYEREAEENKRLKPIYDSFSKSSHVEEVYEISEQYQIAKVKEKFNGEEETLYMPFVNYKKTSVYYDSLEAAMIGAIANIAGKEQTVQFICDGFGVIPEKNRSKNWRK